MKKLLVLSLIAFLGFALNAQVLKIGEKGHDIYHYSKSTDVASGTTAKAWEIEVNKPSTYLYDVIVELDSAGDGTDFTVELEGGYDGTEYYDITSMTWGVSSTDTTIRFNNLTQSKSLTESLGAYSLIGRGTITNASHLIVWDTASANGDSATVGAQVYTRADTVTTTAQTVTKTESISLMGYKWLQIKVTGGGASAGLTLDYISVAILSDD